MWARVAEKHHFSSTDAFKHINLTTAAPFLKLLKDLLMVKLGYLAKIDSLKAVDSIWPYKRMGSPVVRSLYSTSGSEHPQVNMNGQILPQVHGCQMTFNSKSCIPFVNALLQYFCHGTKDLWSTASTLPEPCCPEKGNGQRDRCLFHEFWSGFWYVGLAGLILTHSMLPSSTPPTRDTWYFLPCFSLPYHQEDAGRTRSTPHPFRNWICCWECNYG